MPLNPNSHFLGLMRELNHVYRETEEHAIEAIRTVIICTLVLFIEGLGVAILLKSPCVGFITGIYVGWSVYLIRIEIPRQFNIKEIKEAIEGDTFAIMEVNVELVTLWLGKCNICLGRCLFIRRIYVPWSVLFGLTLILIAI